MILIRVLANPWNVRVSRMLREAFGLTDAEVEIAQLLYEYSDPAAVADARGTSLRTVRNQLQQIFDKTQASGQVELVRLLALLCANTADRASPQAGWQDPLGRERIFEDRLGRRIAYSWMGKEGGRPALLIHGPLSGYVLANEIEEAVTAAGIQIFTLCRPGFGNSDPAKGDALEDGVNAILALADHLDFRDCLGIGIVNGLVPLIEAAAQAKGRFGRLLGIGSTFPLSPANMKHLPPVQRTVFALAYRRAKALDVIIAAGLRLARRYGVEFVLARATASSKADREALFNPDNLGRVMASASMVIAQDGSAFTRDLSLMFHDFRPALAQACPLHILAGEVDPIFPLWGVEEMADAGLCTFEIVPGAGQDLYYSALDQVAAAICHAGAMLGSVDAATTSRSTPSTGTQ
jgi:DNA-binding CsgD family transcriptional regulator/pimeloyl-ACP methyl ester carboxylesterase